MRSAITEMVEGIGNQPQGKDRLVAMCVHSLFLVQGVCKREPFAGPVLGQQIVEVGSKFTRTKTPQYPMGVLFGLKSISQGFMMDLVKPGTPAGELVGKCLIDLELCRAIFTFLGENEDEIVMVDKVAEGIRHNVPLNILEQIETKCTTAIQQTNDNINDGTWI